MRRPFMASLPLSAGFKTVDVLLHSVRALLLHLLRHVAILVQRERRRVMTQVRLHRLDVVTRSDGLDGIAVSEAIETDVRLADRSNNPL